jgi:hypothetical protein
MRIRADADPDDTSMVAVIKLIRSEHAGNDPVPHGLAIRAVRRLLGQDALLASSTVTINVMRAGCVRHCRNAA